jgi:REP element-mobilizing transposase RayT
MPRPERSQVPDLTYHVIAHAVDEGRIVRSDEDRTRLVGAFALAVRTHAWVCLAAALLDTHFHLLLTLRDGNLSRGMQRLNGAYAADFNRRYKRRGHLFGSRFYSGEMEGDGHMLTTVRYIARQGVEAGVVSDPAADRWNSYAGVIGAAECWPFIDRSELLRYFGSGQSAVDRFRDFVEGG